MTEWKGSMERSISTRPKFDGSPLFQPILEEDETEKHKELSVDTVKSLMMWNTQCSDAQDGGATGMLVGTITGPQTAATHW